MIKIVSIKDIYLLSKGNIYEVKLSNWLDSHYDIYIQSHGFFRKSYFLTLEKWREQQINKILESI